MTAYVPRFSTSNAKAEGRFGKQDFVYKADEDVYLCPAGQRFSLPFHQRRRRQSHAELLGHGLLRLSAQGKMHHRQDARIKRCQPEPLRVTQSGWTRTQV